ncbi:plasmid pRiA4b ORF-3 family protein [Litoribacter populi]|uniref:plasmid pRiA4b ORF-3 family protein n=1 Tax=Litoribacter populi TaxID=2598460 RepID=UPI00117CDC36|nr:plasmid pRiA4b ORF-3 family protein [Litoribacter populi]
MSTPIISIQPDPIKLKISLEDMPVPVFRAILVPAHISMGRLHEIIQSVMPWDDEHLYQFIDKMEKPAYKTGLITGDCMEDDELEDAEETSLREEFLMKRKGAPFYYEYDFGDSWIHRITFEEVSQEDKNMFKGKAMLLEAEGNCPPENIGGPGGYQHFLTVINDPDNPENASLREWLEWDEDDRDPWDVNDVNIEILREFLGDYDKEI